MAVSNTFIDARVATVTANLTDINLKTVKGRFVIGTSSGTPLMYGFPGTPWSSYTTVNISDPLGTTLAIYGSDGGAWLSSPADSPGNSVNTGVWRIYGIRVTQSLSLVKNPRSNGNPDSIGIQYTVQNNLTSTATVGLRVMIDTQLGDNDNSPIVAQGAGEITQEQSWSGAAVPSSWYTLDSFFSPAIRAEGALSLALATPPDIFMIGDWSNMKEDANRWTYTTSSQPIDDTAVAVFWNPLVYAAGQSRSFMTYYGIQDSSGAMAISKSVDMAAASYGDTLSFNIAYSNVTTYPLTGISIWDSLPWNATFVDASGPYTANNNVISWSGIPDITGNTTSYDQWVRVRINDGQGISVTNQAGAMYTDTYWNDNEVSYSKSSAASINTLTPSSTPTHGPSFTVTPTFTASPTATISPTFTPTPQPLNLKLIGSFPNPAQYAANFVFSLTRDADIKLFIYTVSGEQVVIRMNHFQKGRNSFAWDLTNSRGKNTASGNYIYIIEATTDRNEKETAKGKMSIIR